MPKAPTVYFAEEEEERLAKFDDHFSARRPGSWSRSDEIKQAMDLHRTVDEILADAGVSPDSPRDRTALVRQALLDYLSEE